MANMGKLQRTCSIPAVVLIHFPCCNISLHGACPILPILGLTVPLVTRLWLSHVVTDVCWRTCPFLVSQSPEFMTILMIAMPKRKNVVDSWIGSQDLCQENSRMWEIYGNLDES